MKTRDKTIWRGWGLFFLTFASCTMPLGQAQFPTPSVATPPRQEFVATYNQLWGRIARVLEDNRIEVASSDKSSGRMVTEYVQGQSQMTALGLLGTIATRYKYTIRVEKIDPQHTRVTARCVLESSGNEMSAWRDVSRDNSHVVTQLERWLYEQIGLPAVGERKLTLAEVGTLYAMSSPHSRGRKPIRAVGNNVLMEQRRDAGEVGIEYFLTIGS